MYGYNQMRNFKFRTAVTDSIHKGKSKQFTLIRSSHLGRTTILQPRPIYNYDKCEITCVHLKTRYTYYIYVRRF